MVYRPDNKVYVLPLYNKKTLQAEAGRVSSFTQMLEINFKDNQLKKDPANYCRALYIMHSC